MQATTLAALLLLTLAHGCAADEVAARLMSLESKFEALQQEFASFKASVGLKHVQESTPTAGTDQGAIEVHSNGATHERRLQSGNPSTFVAVAKPRILHEFPNGHSCSNVNGYIAQLPHTGSAVSWGSAPSWTDDADGKLSLGSVNDDWSTNEIQRFTAPFIVQHDSACTDSPSLRLGLNTSVPALWVDGVGDLATLAARVTALESINIATLAVQVDAALAMAAIVPTASFTSWTVWWTTGSTSTGSTDPHAWNSNKKCDDQSGASVSNQANSGTYSGYNPYSEHNACREFCSQSARTNGYTGSFCCSFKNNGGTTKCALSAKGAGVNDGSGSNWYSIRGHIQ